MKYEIDLRDFVKKILKEYNKVDVCDATVDNILFDCDLPIKGKVVII